MNKEKSVYKKIKPLVRVSFVGKEKFFGKGIAELLELVDKYGTIQKACKSMDMSYSKAWAMFADFINTGIITLFLNIF